MEKLADALPLLQEDDLLQVVQMVHDNKTEDTYTKNDTESESLPSVRLERFGCFAMIRGVRGAMLIRLYHRRRVPRRPLHATGPAHQDALGLLRQEDEHERLDGVECGVW